MPLRYRAQLRSSSGYTVQVPTFHLSESYNTGWGGTVTLTASRDDGVYLSPITYLNVLISTDFAAGQAATLDLLDADAGEGAAAVRKWPCVISGVHPVADGRRGVECTVRIVDPISALAIRTVWGAYSVSSAAEIVGGMLSVAAGGDGKPTLAPVLPSVPVVEVVPKYRTALSRLPYALAVGRPLGEWLATFVGMLGLRAELTADPDANSCVLTLTDSLPTSLPWKMAVLDAETGTAPEIEDGRGVVAIRGQSAFPGTRARGGLLDDPIAGGARPLIAQGGIGSVVSAPDVNVDEASERLVKSLYGNFAEMLLLHCATRQPLLAPGKLVDLTPPPHGLEHWQVASAAHVLRGEVYDSDITLIRGDVGWFPPLPARQAPALVSGIVDEGPEIPYQQPVPRDRLGRIHVYFPFTPTPVGEEAKLLAAADSDNDRELTLDDFTSEMISSFTTDEVTWEESVGAYESGAYDDPFPGKLDDELTAEELARRSELLGQRERVLKYLAYKKAIEHDEADRDRDGVVSDLDEFVSEELEAELRDPDKREELQQKWESAVDDGTVDELDPGTDALVLEYGRLFGDAEAAGLDPTDVDDAEILAARADAEVLANSNRWPPRIPLTMVEPMAGALHGFITGHRQGDICRVAVHDPFFAEVVGFQYRDDRRINDDLAGALTGLVVEHNFSDAWSGMVFRRTTDLTGNASSADSEEPGDGAESDSD